MGADVMSSLAGHSASSPFQLFCRDKPRPSTLGIVAFDTAKTMSRLVSIYRSLADAEFTRFREDTIRSQGVVYLNSGDETFLLNLACAERLEDLENAAAAIARLGYRCSDLGLTRFDLVYADLKQGLIDIGRLDYNSRKVERAVARMERLISTTANLYSAMELLAELETSARKLNQWKKNAGANQLQKANFDLFENKLAFQRKQVRNLKAISLWNKTFDKTVSLMAKIVCVVYARVCVLFGTYMSDLPCLLPRKKQHQQHPQRYIRVHPDIYAPIDYGETYHRTTTTTMNSGPITSLTSKSDPPKFYSRELNRNLLLPKDLPLRHGQRTGEARRSKAVYHSARESTVGGAGLTLRYASVIAMAERFLHEPGSVGEDTRGHAYGMLPGSLREKVGSKLRGHRRELGGAAEEGEELAEGWREAVEGIMAWLGPVAEDTLRWQAERNLEKQRLDSKKGRVLLAQTLHFADLEKTEAAIVEVLVGLSFVHRYQDKRAWSNHIHRIDYF